MQNGTDILYHYSTFTADRMPHAAGGDFYFILFFLGGGVGVPVL